MTGQDEQAVVEVAFGFEVLPEERARYFADMLDTLGDTRVPEALRDTEFFTRIGCTVAAQAGGGSWLEGEQSHLIHAWVWGPADQRMVVFRRAQEGTGDAPRRAARWAITNWLDRVAQQPRLPEDSCLDQWREDAWVAFMQGFGSPDYDGAHHWWTLVKEFAQRIVYLKQDRSVSPTPEMQDSAEYAEDGANAGAALHYLHNTQPSLRQEVEETLKALSLRSLRDVTFKPSARTVTPLLNFTDMGVQLRFDEVGAGIPHTLMLVLGVILAPDGGLCLVEEPELHIHPDVQGQVLAFLEEQSRSKQIIVTTHSPAIAGRAGKHAVHLISAGDGGTSALHAAKEGATQRIAKELGIRPHDEIAGARLVLFVEGRSDAEVLKIFSCKLHEADKLPATLEDAYVAVLPGGGSSLEYVVSSKACDLLNRPTWVVADKNAGRSQPIPKDVQRLKDEAQACGRTCRVWRMHSIESYFHPDAIQSVFEVRVEIGEEENGPKKLKQALQRGGGRYRKYDKARDAPKMAEAMTVQQILERDKYEEDGAERHEVSELLTEVIKAAQGRHEEDE